MATNRMRRSDPARIDRPFSPWLSTAMALAAATMAAATSTGVSKGVAGPEPVAGAARAVLAASLNDAMQSPDHLLSAFRAWNEVDLHLPPDGSGAFSVAVANDGRAFTLDLERFSLRAQRFELLVPIVEGGLQEFAAPAPRTYRGVVRGVSGSLVAATLRNGLLRATIHLPDEVLVIEPMEQLAPDLDTTTPDGRPKHVLYAGRDLRAAPGLCGSDLLDHPEAPSSPGSEGGLAAGGDPPLIAITEIAFDLDYDFFQINGSSLEAALLDLEAVMNTTDLIFRRDAGIGFVITATLVRTSPEVDYTEQEIYARLCAFRSQWNEPPLKNIRRDLVHHLAGFNFPGSIIGLAWRPGMCNLVWNDTATCPAGGLDSIGYGLSETFYQGPATALFRRVGLTAHEIGHNWNAQHCNGQGADNCNIMCSIINGCGGLSGDNLKFNPWNVNQMVSLAASISCAPPVEFNTIASTGGQRRTWVDGALVHLGWPVGHVAPTAPLRRFAAPFTVPEPPAGRAWALRRIVGTGFVTPADGFTPGVVQSLGWSIFKRQPGNPAPVAGDLVASGLVALPIPYHESPDERGTSAWPIDLATALPLPPGDYYLSLHGDNGSPEAPAAWSWMTYGPSGQALSQGDLVHAWRSDTGVFTLFAPTNLAVQDGDSPDTVLSHAFTLEGTLTEAPCPADTNGDGVVDGSDLALLLGSWGPCAECAGDLDGNGAIDGADIAILLGVWGPCGR